jgi:hypothetical protein
VLTLIVIPAAYIYMDRLANWLGRHIRRLAGREIANGSTPEKKATSNLALPEAETSR